MFFDIAISKLINGRFWVCPRETICWYYEDNVVHISLCSMYSSWKFLLDSDSRSVLLYWQIQYPKKKYREWESLKIGVSIYDGESRVYHRVFCIRECDILNTFIQHCGMVIDYLVVLRFAVCIAAYARSQWISVSHWRSGRRNWLQLG